MSINARELGSLIKYKLSLAVTASSLTGFLIGNPSFGYELLLMLAGVFLLACGSAALNQYSERFSDSLMDRTRERPIPGGKIKPLEAVYIAIVLFLAGTLLLALCGKIPAFLGVITVVVYNFIYTPLKKVTHFALFPGAVVGALPPLIGFFSSGINNPSADILLFSGFMFMWQVPHFWLINTRYREEYQKAGIKSIYPELTVGQVRFLVFVWVTASVLILSIMKVAGIAPSGVNNITVLAPSAAFLAAFSLLLFRNPLSSTEKATFILINIFSLIVMAIFIAGAFLR